MAHSPFHFRSVSQPTELTETHTETHGEAQSCSETHSKDKQGCPLHIHAPENTGGTLVTSHMIPDTGSTAKTNLTFSVLTRWCLLQTKITSGGVQTRRLSIYLFSFGWWHWGASGVLGSDQLERIFLGPGTSHGVYSLKVPSRQCTLPHSQGSCGS